MVYLKSRLEASRESAAYACECTLSLWNCVRARVTLVRRAVAEEKKLVDCARGGRRFRLGGRSRLPAAAVTRVHSNKDIT